MRPAVLLGCGVKSLFFYVMFYLGGDESQINLSAQQHYFFAATDWESDRPPSPCCPRIVNQNEVVIVAHNLIGISRQ